MSESPTGFRPANTLSIVVVIGLALMCICETITFCMSIGEIVDPTRMIRVSDQANSTWLLIQATTGLFQSTIYVATAVMFLIWIFRIYKNLDSLENQQHREFSAGWAVGWWFVPFANLLNPFKSRARRGSTATPRSRPSKLSFRQASVQHRLTWAFGGERG